MFGVLKRIENIKRLPADFFFRLARHFFPNMKYKNVSNSPNATMNKDAYASVGEFDSKNG